MQHWLLPVAGPLPGRDIAKVVIVALSFSIRRLEFFAEMTPARLLTLECITAHQLREFQKITGGSRYLFPSVRSCHRPISDSNLNAALSGSDTTRSN